MKKAPPVQNSPKSPFQGDSDNSASNAGQLVLERDGSCGISGRTIAALKRFSEIGIRPRLLVELARSGDTIKSTNMLLRLLWDLRREMKFDIDVCFSLPPGAEKLSAEELHRLKFVEPAPGSEISSKIWRVIAENLRLKFEADESEKLIINVTYRCNNHCGFCSVSDRERIDGSFGRQISAIDSARRRGVRSLDIDGGEPLLYDHLFDLLAEAQSNGFERITVTSNGRLLSDSAFCRRLADTGVDLLVSLHASREDIHDRLVSVPGAWRQSVKGIMNACRYFKQVGINVTVLNENVDDIPRLAELAAKLGVKVFNIQIYTPFGVSNPGFAPSFEKLRENLPKALEILKGVMPVYLVNAPHCALPGYEEYAALDYHKAVRRMLFADGEEVNLAEYLASRRFKNGLCEVCPQDGICGGFWDYGTDPQSGEKYRVRMLDVIAGYPCDADCPFCAIEDELWTLEMNTAEVKSRIDSALRFGPSLLRFGGGEPSIRPDFFELLEHAASRSFERISVQTHGFRLADMNFVRRMSESGCGKVNISVRGHNAALHEALTRKPGSFESLCDGIRNVCRDGRMQLELDMLIGKLNYRSLSEELHFFRSLGARRFNMWFISLEGRVRKRADELAARMSEAAPFVKAACDAAQKLNLESFKVYYLPYCFMKGYEEFVWHPLDENVLVLSPGGDFKLDRGSIDIGLKPEPCRCCAMRERCFGLAPAYMQHFGFEELTPYEHLPEKS